MMDYPQLSILICHLPEREHLFDRLLDVMDEEIMLHSFHNNTDDWWAVFEDEDHFILNVEILVDSDPTDSVGTKRNRLLNRAKGNYVAFIDDDDFISENYFKSIFKGIQKYVDCCSLTGEITEDGKNPLLFEHSIKYKEYKTNDGNPITGLVFKDGRPIKYERYPNHLNCIKASIAKQFKFPEKNHGEDTDWATQIFKSGLIKTEHYIPEILYYYDHRSKK